MAQMFPRSNAFLGILVFTVSVSTAAAPEISREQGDSLARKIDAINENATAKLATPKRTPITEPEVNSYLAFNIKEKIPRGLTQPQIRMVGNGQLAGRVLVDMVDVSHASKDAMMQIATLSNAPIIASHSAVRALCDVSRNMDDEQLLALQKTGGVIQVVAYNGFIKTTKAESPERLSALAALRKEYDIPETNGPGQRARLPLALKDWPDERRNQFESRIAEIDKQYPGEMPATLKDFVDHIDYAVNLIGIDHVGISSDFDGGGGVIGWNDATETFAVTLELIRRGYTEAQIEKLWGENLLRVMGEAERIARELQK